MDVEMKCPVNFLGIIFTNFTNRSHAINDLISWKSFSFLIITQNFQPRSSLTFHAVTSSTKFRELLAQYACLLLVSGANVQFRDKKTPSPCILLAFASKTAEEMVSVSLFEQPMRSFYLFF